MTLLVQPLADHRALDTLRSDLNVNISQGERIGSTAAGALLVGFGLTRRSLPGLLLALGGAALLRRGLTGHCEVYQKMGLDSLPSTTEAGVPGNKGINVEQNIFIQQPPAELYRFWRRLDNLPRFMEHVERVEVIDEHRSHWTVKGPAGSHFEWDASIVNEREPEMISWASLPGAEVQNAGTVRFEPAGAGTQVTVKLQYQPPAGVVGATVAKLFGEAPGQQLANDLQRWKQLMEAESSAMPAP